MSEVRKTNIALCLDWCVRPLPTAAAPINERNRNLALLENIIDFHYMI